MVGRRPLLVFLVFLFLPGGTACARDGESLTIEEYRDRLAACSEHITAASGAPGEPGSLVDALSACRDEIGSVTVTFAGQPVAVRNEWISELLDNSRSRFHSDDEVRDEALERLAALRSEIERPVLYGASDHAGRVLEDVLARGEFAGRERKESGVAAWMGRLMEDVLNWIGRHAERIFDRIGDALRPILEFLVPDSETGGAGLHLGRGLLYVLGIILVLLLLYLLVRVLLSSRVLRKAPHEFDEDEEIVELPRPDELLARAGEFRAEGNYRAAVRFCYLSLIAFLEDRGLVRYDRSKTNWEYARELGSGYDRRDLFVSLTNSFDTAWYGMRHVQEDDFSRFRDGCDEIVGREGGPT